MMNYLWKIIRNTLGVVGFCTVLGAVGKSDYYLIELGQLEPAYVMPMIYIGLLMMIPALIHAVCGAIREYEENVHDR